MPKEKWQEQVDAHHMQVRTSTTPQTQMFVPHAASCF